MTLENRISQEDRFAYQPFKSEINNYSQSKTYDQFVKMGFSKEGLKFAAEEMARDLDNLTRSTPDLDERIRYVNELIKLESLSKLRDIELTVNALKEDGYFPYQKPKDLSNLRAIVILGSSIILSLLYQFSSN